MFLAILLEDSVLHVQQYNSYVNNANAKSWRKYKTKPWNRVSFGSVVQNAWKHSRLFIYVGSRTLGGGRIDYINLRLGWWMAYDHSPHSPTTASSDPGRDLDRRRLLDTGTSLSASPCMMRTGGRVPAWAASESLQGSITRLFRARAQRKAS